jgi:hypothetical protein
LGRYDGSNNLFLTERTPFRYDDTLDDTIQHEIGENETLAAIAYLYYKTLKRPDGSRRDGWGPEHLWWIICEFQPTPITDPTLALDVGRVLEIPSPAVVQRLVFGE